ncbi:hypothetical protein PEBR_24459 [Penicillium brasilianum]|uniref:Uncharacterized protein n=1 Tax=Penicillium brasilianum TaxID=104259 RepID=A0A1S9RKU6_PENBI|nr:hypothetical protein PEBR_24459 [Penicillium brasilianum]
MPFQAMISTHTPLPCTPRTPSRPPYSTIRNFDPVRLLNSGNFPSRPVTHMALDDHHLRELWVSQEILDPGPGLPCPEYRHQPFRLETGFSLPRFSRQKAGIATPRSRDRPRVVRTAVYKA